MELVTIEVKLPKEVYDSASEILAKQGLTMEDALILFLKETVRLGMKITVGGGNGKPLSLKEINSQINELLKASIQSEGVINLFESAKMGENRKR